MFVTFTNGRRLEIRRCHRCFSFSYFLRILFQVKVRDLPSESKVAILDVIVYAQIGTWVWPLRHQNHWHWSCHHNVDNKASFVWPQHGAFHPCKTLVLCWEHRKRLRQRGTIQELKEKIPTHIACIARAHRHIINAQSRNADGVTLVSDEGVHTSLSWQLWNGSQQQRTTLAEPIKISLRWLSCTHTPVLVVACCLYKNHTIARKLR